MIRVENAHNGKTGDHSYFLELIVTRNETKWRIIDHVVLSSAEGKLCRPVVNFWNPDVTIYVIITAKNQGIWLRHFIDNMVDIKQQTKDNNIHPIIVDFASEDIDIDKYLKNSNVNHFTGTLIDSFSKTRSELPKL